MYLLLPVLDSDGALSISMQLVIRKGLDAPLPQRTDADTVLPCGASDRRLAAACQWPMADCLTGHHIACALLGDFEPLPGATFLAIAAAAVFRIAKERPERIVRLHLSLVHTLNVWKNLRG